MGNCTQKKLIYVRRSRRSVRFVHLISRIVLFSSWIDIFGLFISWTVNSCYKVCQLGTGHPPPPTPLRLNGFRPLLIKANIWITATLDNGCIGFGLGRDNNLCRINYIHMPTMHCLYFLTLVINSLKASSITINMYLWHHPSIFFVIWNERIYDTIEIQILLLSILDAPLVLPLWKLIPASESKLSNPKTSWEFAALSQLSTWEKNGT